MPRRNYIRSSYEHNGKTVLFTMQADALPQNHHVARLLGFEEGRPPREGMSERTLFGHQVWVVPLDLARMNGQFHRVLCRCRFCGTEMSVGRLHQHVNTKSCSGTEVDRV